MKEKAKDTNDNEILRYIEEHGIENKDAARAPKKRRKKTVSKKRARDNRQVVDLHGKTSEQAALILKNIVRSCKKSGTASLLIIHGKGHSSDPDEGPVLKRLVYIMLKGELREYVRDYTFALPRDGGDGATLVTIK